MPLNDYAVSVEKSILNVSYPSNLGFKYKEFNFNTLNVKKTQETATFISFEATKIIAQKIETDCPSVMNLFPRVMMGLELFHLEGVDGNAKSWLNLENGIMKKFCQEQLNYLKRPKQK
jgi:hypothetical protein